MHQPRKWQSEFSMCDINKIRSKNMPNFKNSVTVLDETGNKLNGDVSFFTEGRHHNIQMIVMRHKPAQIINTARMRCDTFYLTTDNRADLFENFNDNI